MNMNLTIVLVNYKCNKEKLQSCLNSIKIQSEVLIIDHSHDFTFENVNKPENLNFNIIRNTNLGNGAGINCGLKNSKTRLVLYLDIDTVLPLNFFEILEHSVKKIENFAVLAPRINNIYDEYTLNNSGNLIFTQFLYNKIFHKIKLEETNYKNIKQQFFVSGAIMLIDKENTYNKGIRFDENIFMFFEENDFFHQCFKMNQKIFLINDLIARHDDGSVNDQSLNYEFFKKWQWEWSKYYFLNKHYNKTLIFFIALKSTIKYLIKICFFYFFNKNKFNIYRSRLNGILSFYQNKKSLITNEL